MKNSKPLSENEVKTYRELLVKGLDEISLRCSSAVPFSLTFAWLDTPKHMKERMVLMYVKEFANWLRKLACSSEQDFRGFNADEFWQNYDEICKNHPAHIGPRHCHSRDWNANYREWFNKTLASYTDNQPSLAA